MNLIKLINSGGIKGTKQIMAWGEANPVAAKVGLAFPPITHRHSCNGTRARC